MLIGFRELVLFIISYQVFKGGGKVGSESEKDAANLDHKKVIAKPRKFAKTNAFPYLLKI